MKVSDFEDMIDDTMDIYSPKGTKVVFTGLNGYDSDKEYSKSILTIGTEYTVDTTEVHQSSTSVILEEYPNHRFNSVHFKPKKL